MFYDQYFTVVAVKVLFKADDSSAVGDDICTASMKYVISIPNNCGVKKHALH